MKKETEKKPIYKKWWFWVIIVLLVVSAFGSNKKKQNDPGTAETTPATVVQTTSAVQQTETVQEETTAPVTTVAAAMTAPETEPATEAESVQGSGVFSDVSVSAVNNDTTGKWKIAIISKDIEIQDYALEYYNTFFQDSSEIHAIINSFNRTTTCITSPADYLDVTIHEYVDGEERDAYVLFDGDVLKEYHVDKENGAIEEIKLDN